MAGDTAALTFVAQMRDTASGPARELRRTMDNLGGPVDDITAAIRTEGDRAALANIEKVDNAGVDLAGQTFDPRVDAETAGAEAALDGVRRDLTGLAGERAEVEVDADTSAARAELRGLANDAADAGADGGERAGGGLVSGIVGSLKSIPVAGAVVGIGVAAGVALLAGIRDGLGQEVGRDLFSARTGLDEATSARFGRAAGEAYANNFGESIEANMDTARIAVQSGLLDPAATQRDATAMIESLAGVADVLGEEVPAVARAAGRAIKTDLAGSAEEAFDLIVKGQQAGINTSEDLLDTLSEYGAGLAAVGLTGPQAVGLINQAMRAGVDNSDRAADSIREWGRIAREEPDRAKAAWKDLGLNVGEMTRLTAEGGESTARAFDMVMDKIRGIEDPQRQALAITQLLGDAAGDFGTAWAQMDLSTAVEQLGTVEGAASSALSTMGDNAAGQIESARRNIEVAADGIKGALASAFSDEIGGAAAWVSRNRGPMMEFLLDGVNGALDLGGAIVEGMATGGRGVGRFLAGPAADFVDGLAAMTDQVGFLFGADADTVSTLRQEADALRESGAALSEVSDTMETEWGSALDGMRDRVNEWAGPELIAAHIHDAVQDAQGRLDELSSTIDATGGTVTINGNQRNAEGALEDIVSNIDESDGTVTINGDRVPANMALSYLMALITSSTGSVSIGGNTAPGTASVGGFTAWANRQGAAVDVGADTSRATSQVDAWVSAMSRTRSVRIQTITAAGGNTGGGFALGGYTGDGPRYAERGPVHAGEFVFTQEATRDYRAEFEAIAAGASPAQVFAASAAPAGLGGELRVTIDHRVTSDGSMVNLDARHLERVIAGDPRLGATIERAVRGASRTQAARTLTASN